MPTLRGKRRVWRIADRSFPLYSGFGAFTFGARWNSPGSEVIYAGGSLEGAILELRVHTGNLPAPSKHGYIWIDLPSGLSIERVSRSEISGWRKSQDLTRTFGDKWLRELRSCVLIVPSVIVPAPYVNYLINPRHAEATQISFLKVPRSLRWDSRLF